MASSAVGTSSLQSQPIYGDAAGWYSLLERVSNRSLSSQEALEHAIRGRQIDGDSRWVLPLAMAHWLEGRYPDALKALFEPSVVQACDPLWLYHNLVGMVARKVEGQNARAVKAFERSLELEPDRPDTLYNFANLLKDDDPERAVDLYRRSLVLEPSAASAWHNYGTALNSLTQYEGALLALRLSLRLDPLVADVWCNLGLAYFGLRFHQRRTGISSCHLVRGQPCSQPYQSEQCPDQRSSARRSTPVFGEGLSWIRALPTFVEPCPRLFTAG